MLALRTFFSRSVSGQYLERGLRVWFWVTCRVMDTTFFNCCDGGFRVMDTIMY